MAPIVFKNIHSDFGTKLRIKLKLIYDLIDYRINYENFLLEKIRFILSITAFLTGFWIVGIIFILDYFIILIHPNMPVFDNLRYDDMPQYYINFKYNENDYIEVFVQDKKLATITDINQNPMLYIDIFYDFINNNLNPKKINYIRKHLKFDFQ